VIRGKPWSQAGGAVLSDSRAGADSTQSKPASRQRGPLPTWHGWELLLVLPTAVLLVTPADWPRWVFMWLLAGAIYAGCKWLTWRRTPAPEASLWRHAGYLLLWPGLDAPAFLDPQVRPSCKPSPGEWGFALGKLTLGLVLFFGITRLVPSGLPYLAGWVGMAGVVFVLHFGLFHLLSCGWRSLGVEARPLMNWPVVSTSLGEFWGRRWNTAFRDLTHRFLFRPLMRLGPGRAALAGFVFSGLAHDAVISLPAGGGYGGPTLYFLLSGAGILAERSRWGRSVGLGRGGRGWVFTMLVLLLPACLLFHPPFVLQIVVPMMHDLGAL
jgi:Membrane bound O-acyl transferase family